MRSIVRLLSAAAAVVLLALWAPPAGAAEALFPAVPPATQVTREVSLAQAAQAGAVKLGAKGGFTGDDVSLELEGKRFPGPITVTVRAEFTAPEGKTPAELEALRDLIPNDSQQAEAELNRLPGNKTSSGDPVRFKLEWKWREPGEAPRPNFHQVTVVDPLKDLPEPDKDFRSSTAGLGVPNAEGNEVEATFTAATLGKPNIMGHEMLHLAGLDDRYTDVYRYKGASYPLPEKGMAPTALKEYLAKHKPPLPPPPAGKVDSKNIKGTSPCDIMGTGGHKKCRKISQKDLDWFGTQAGTLVTVEPGQTLLNKDESVQNLGVGFKTIVFARPGQTTVANGVSAYCLDHDRLMPIEGLLDVGPMTSELPGYEGLAKLLAYNAATAQASLDETPIGMQAAIWNQTDGAPPTPASADEARAILASAGVGENTTGVDLPRLANPNAGSPTTGVVSASGEVLPATSAGAIETSVGVRLDAVQLQPRRFHARHKAFADLVIAANGDVIRLALEVQRKVGKRWKSTKTLSTRLFEPGTTVVPLGLGRLAVGKYRLVVSVSGPLGEPVTRTVGFTAGK